MAGRSWSVKTVAQPVMSSELSQTKKPRLKGPLVLSVDGLLFESNKIRLFSMFSNTSNASFKIVEVESTAAYATFTERSHSVRKRAASKRRVVKRYEVRRKDGRMDLTCSICERRTMQHAATRLRTAAAMENLVSRCREEAVRARHPTWMPAYALDTIYWNSIRGLILQF